MLTIGKIILVDVVLPKEICNHLITVKDGSYCLFWYAMVIPQLYPQLIGFNMESVEPYEILLLFWPKELHPSSDKHRFASCVLSSPLVIVVRLI